MRCALVVVLIWGLIFGLTVPVAEAGHHGAAASVALGLASFAVFNQLVAPFVYPRPFYAAPVYVAPPPQVIYAPPPVLAVAPPAPPVRNAVYYPHGRYELQGDGVTTAYYWVWIPNPPPPPPAGYDRPSARPSPPAPAPSAAESCKPTGRYVKTPRGTLPECE